MSKGCSAITVSNKFVYYNGEFSDHYETKMFGNHLVLDALGTIAVAIIYNIDKRVIKEVAEEFEKLTGRKYGFFEEYKTEDAEYIIVAMNSTAGTAKYTVDLLRKQGIKAGVLKIRMYRQFPAEQIANALKNAKAVAVLDKADGLNGVGGPLFTEITSGMQVNKTWVPTVSYIYGIGGRDTKSDDIETVFKDLQKIAEDGKIDNPYRYLGLRK